MQTSNISLTIGGNTARSKLGQHSVEIDWNALPDAAQEFVIRYGLKQYLADGMAGAESETDAAEGVAERKRKLLEADFQRARGEGKADSETTRALKLARAAIRGALKAQGKTSDKEKIEAAAQKLVDTQPKWKAEAKKQLAAEAKAAEDMQAEDTSDLLADLMTPDAED